MSDKIKLKKHLNENCVISESTGQDLLLILRLLKNAETKRITN